MPGDIKHDLRTCRGVREVGTGVRSVALHALVGLALALGSGVAALGAESPKTPEPPDFRHLPPLPAVQEAARVAGLKLTGVTRPLDRKEMRPGDSVTFLVSLTDGGRLRQWVFAFTMESPTEKESQRPHDRLRLFTLSGAELHFDGGRAAIRMTVIGPLKASDAGTKAASAPAIRHQRILVDADFLALGMDRMVAMLLRLRAFGLAHPNGPHGNLSVGEKPFPPEAIAANRPAMEAAGITPDDERAFIGSILALKEFVTLAARTPGMQDVFKSVADIPWWSILTSGGNVNLGINFSDTHRELAPADWRLPATEKVYASPSLLTINGKRALLFQLAVVSPQPPLGVCAGIVGLAAGSPNGKGPVLTLELVESHAAPAPASP